VILKISIVQANLDYLGSVCSGIESMSRHINHLISNDRKEHEDIDDNDGELDQMLRLSQAPAGIHLSYNDTTSG
jgi:hypothetical protein